MLTLYGPDGEVALPLLPKRALTLAQELLTRGVQATKADSWDVMYEQGAPQRGPDLGAARWSKLSFPLTSRAQFRACPVMARPPGLPKGSRSSQTS